MREIKDNFMPASRIYRIFLLIGLLSLFASYLGIWGRLINDPVERTGSDFIAFYSAGRVADKEGYPEVYQPALQQEVQEEQVGFPLVKGQVLLYNHLPFLLPILRALVSYHYVNSFYRWVVLLIIIYILSLLILSKVLKDFLDNTNIWLFGIGSFLFLPLYFSLMNGQDTAILLLGAAIWSYGIVSGHETMAGLGLSLTTVRPHISLILAIPMVFSYRKAFSSYLIGSGILALLSVLIVGMSGTRDFIDILLISAAGEWHGLKEGAMFNFIGLSSRVLPAPGIENIRMAGWIIYALSILGLCFLWARKKDLKSQLIAITLVIALFTAPHLHFHDLTLLLVPLYMFVRLEKLKNSTATLLPIALSFILLISNSSVVLHYTTPYLLMLAVVCFISNDFRTKSASTIPNQSQLQGK